MQRVVERLHQRFDRQGHRLDAACVRLLPAARIVEAPAAGIGDGITRPRTSSGPSASAAIAAARGGSRCRPTSRATRCGSLSCRHSPGRLVRAHCRFLRFAGEGRAPVPERAMSARTYRVTSKLPPTQRHVHSAPSAVAARRCCVRRKGVVVPPRLILPPPGAALILLAMLLSMSSRRASLPRLTSEAAKAHDDALRHP